MSNRLSREDFIAIRKGEPGYVKIAEQLRSCTGDRSEGTRILVFKNVLGELKMVHYNCFGIGHRSVDMSNQVLICIDDFPLEIFDCVETVITTYLYDYKEKRNAS